MAGEQFFDNSYRIRAWTYSWIKKTQRCQHWAWPFWVL